MPRESSNSAGVTWLDRRARIEALRRALRRAAAVYPIRRAILFGSLARGQATAASDADLLVVLAEAEQSRPRDRIPGMLAAMSPLPCPVDLFVVTEAEYERARREGSALVAEAEQSGLDLLEGDFPGRN